MPDKTSYIQTDRPLYTRNLTARMEANECFGVHDFEAWVFSHYGFPRGCRVMEIACGTGKALFKLLDATPGIHSVYAFDFSEDAIAALRQVAGERAAANVTAAVEDMELVPSMQRSQRFDHIFSIYGIHYSPRMAELLCEYKALLEPGGSIFFCGPDGFCNTSVMRALSRSAVLESDPIPPRMLRSFVSERDLALLRRAFDTVEVSFFENAVRFPDVDAFMQWWSNHDLYREGADTAMREHVQREIDAQGAFAVDKHAIGVTLSVAR